MTWPLVPLGDVAEWGSGGTPRRGVAEYYGEGVPWLSIADLNDGTVNSAKESLTESGIANSSAKVVPAGTLFIAMYGSIGKLGIAGKEMATSQAIAFAKPDKNKIETRYLFNFLMSERPKLLNRGRGGTQMNIGQADLKAWKIPLPPMAEQVRIAGLLDLADEVRAKRRAALALLDTLPQSLFHQMFGSFSASATVGDIATKMRTGPFGSALLHSEFVDEGIAVLGLDNVVGNQFRWAERRYITEEKYKQLKRYTVYPGDVLISIMGTTGRCVIVPNDIPTAINTKHICATTVDKNKVVPDFLRATFLWHPVSRAYLKQQTKGAIMDGLNQTIIKAMPIPLPPLELQQEFARRVEAINAQRALLEQALAKDEELFASLQSRAFSGQLSPCA